MESARCGVHACAAASEQRSKSAGRDVVLGRGTWYWDLVLDVVLALLFSA